MPVGVVYLCLGMVPSQGMDAGTNTLRPVLLCVTSAVGMETTKPQPALTCSF